MTDRSTNRQHGPLVMPGDRQWSIRDAAGVEVGTVSEYNNEITGWSESLHGIVSYSQWLNPWSERSWLTERGWRAVEIKRRT